MDVDMSLSRPCSSNVLRTPCSSLRHSLSLSHSLFLLFLSSLSLVAHVISFLPRMSRSVPLPCCSLLFFSRRLCFPRFVLSPASFLSSKPCALHPSSRVRYCFFCHSCLYSFFLHCMSRQLILRLRHPREHQRLPASLGALSMLPHPRLALRSQLQVLAVRFSPWWSPLLLLSPVPRVVGSVLPRFHASACQAPRSPLRALRTAC